MKRIGNLYSKIYSLDNLILADKKARKGKSKQLGIKLHDLNKDSNILKLQESLINKTFKTSKYSIFKIYEPKEREISILPYYPNRILHHAILNILEPIFTSNFTKDTYSCLKYRGIHGAYRNLNKSLLDKENTLYTLKFDIRKFYPSIDHNILKALLRNKFKDKDLLWLLDEIIDSSNGLPLGNYLSSWLANYYMSSFDHWIKEIKRIKYYFRYCDDIVILSSNKEELHILFKDVKEYLNNNLKLTIKSNYQIFPTRKRGIDFVGYRFFGTYILLRKSIKNKFKRMIKYNKNSKSIASYNGWLFYADTINLQNKYLYE